MKFGALILSFFVIPFALMAEGISNRTGFVDGPVWFSEEILNLDQTVRVYTAVFNGEDSKTSFSVDFLNGEDVISTKEISVSPNETKTVSFDWKVSEGLHNMYGIISSATVGGKNLEITRTKTESVKFSVTKDNPGNVVKSAMLSKFSYVLEGEEGFLNKADSWFKLNFNKSEEWREENLIKISNSKDKVAKDRENLENASSGTKFISALHLYFLIFIRSIFSISIVFYLMAVGVSYFLFRLIWRIVKSIFRRRHEE